MRRAQAWSTSARALSVPRKTRMEGFAAGVSGGDGCQCGTISDLVARGKRAWRPPPPLELALYLESFGFSLLWTFMAFGLASGTLGSVTVRTPSSKLASALFASTPSGKRTDRENAP
jgi:hypothetical protein